MTAPDVRARAESDLAGSVRWALDHCEAGVMPVGGVMSLRAALLAYNESRAALAVAPATAQPVAWAVYHRDGKIPAFLADNERGAESWRGGSECYRVVALVPRESPSEEPAT